MKESCGVYLYPVKQKAFKDYRNNFHVFLLTDNIFSKMFLNEERQVQTSIPSPDAISERAWAGDRTTSSLIPST